MRALAPCRELAAPVNLTLNEVYELDCRAVGLKAGKPAVMLFRWHLGTGQPATISGEGGNWQAVWPEGTLVLTSSVPLTVTQEKLPDNTVCLGKKDNGWDFVHPCVVVRTA